MCARRQPDRARSRSVKGAEANDKRGRSLPTSPPSFSPFHIRCAAWGPNGEPRVGWSGPMAARRGRGWPRGVASVGAWEAQSCLGRRPRRSSEVLAGCAISRIMEASSASLWSSLPGFFYWVGVLSVGYFVFLAASYLVYVVRMWVLGRPGAVGPHLGAWAVITGATDGIGKAYTEELAKRGMKIVLISRSQEKLDQVAGEIKEKFKVETKTISADFEDRETIYSKIKAGLEGLEIGVLVNNVGVSYSYPEYFLEIPDLDKTIEKLINVNVISVCKMTRLVLPGMIERSKGVIINISSLAGLEPSPFLSLYSATKAFVNFFSQGINMEYRHKGVIVQSILPYFVVTKLSKLRRASTFRPKPEWFVKYALNTVGLESQTAGCPTHDFLAWVNKILPKWYTNKVMVEMALKARAHYMKKLKEN